MLLSKLSTSRIQTVSGSPAQETVNTKRAREGSRTLRMEISTVQRFREGSTSQFVGKPK